MRLWVPLAGPVVVLALAAAPDAARALQIPLAPTRSHGQTVTPAFEGWYRNPDGTFSISFGYFNRNGEEILDIPLGPDNHIEPDEFDGAQPTRFMPRRHWGVFAVTVPADFDARAKVTWTLSVRGETFSIPGSLDPLWEIDALEGEAGSGNTPPVLRFAPDGPSGAGPGGITTGPLTATVGSPLELTVWAEDDGAARSSVSRGRQGSPVQVTWFKHQGPGAVTFADETPAADRSDGRASTTATFSAPGDYILRVRANDASGVSGAGHAQCCWSNGFVKVRVTGDSR